ncbi:amidohydrolase family protein [Oscillibacter sp. MSJ-2]|uniref:Adenine deaminase n=1 Tax=Dysosmobacter acutus TaxID=2841504 RepID=A0ABS6F659_9FIRM|nr:adenine deaminase C-terminal domain-containing protein [Dysosmobacter acutus]MBU5625558.1 amidohydrolase family protein [Dysosmobacter acutus]
MQVDPNKDRPALLSAANGQVPCDLTVGNVVIFDVFTGALTPGSVDIFQGVIVCVREGETEDAGKSRGYYDGKGAILLPGFIDTHIHVESTMMIPEHFARTVLPCGTTTVMTDPHETANVAGIAGVRFMLDNSRKTPLRQYVLAPSCVPSVPGLEESGAAFGPEEIGALLELPGVAGIGEVMDYVNVCRDEKRMRGIVQKGLERDVFIQGHAPRLMGQGLNAYILAGAQSDHECRSRQECALKQRLGMHVNLKSSSLSNHLAENLEAVRTQRWKDSVSICTDDVHARRLLTEGHINRVIREAIECGADPMELYRCATYNAAREYRFRDIGAVAPGYAADLQLLRALDGGTPEAVFVGGSLVARDGVYCAEDDRSAPAPVPCPMELGYLASPEDFRLKAPEGAAQTVRTLVIHSKYQGSPFNQGFYEPLPVRGGYVELSGLENTQYCCVCNRYGRPRRTIGVMRGFGILRGALASTVAHDCHNLTLVYTNPEDAFLAMEAVKSIGGGFAVAAEGKVLAVLPLPVMGLMSDRCAREIVPQIAAVEQALSSISDGSCYLLKHATMALPVLPGTLITDLGLVDGPSQTFLPLFDKD